MIEVTLARLWIDKAKETYVVILQESGGQRLLPIWIGPAEAESIRIHLSKIPHERPLTHDLCKNIIVGFGGTLKRIQITKVQQNTYFAELLVAHGENVVSIDARPSDSIAVALRMNAPIFAAESLLITVGEDEEGAPLSPPDDE